MLTPDSKNTPPTAQTDRPNSGVGLGGVNWLRRADDAYESSTSFIDNNYRKQWEDSIRAFHSQHASDSKYNAPAYEKRSRLYRPKTRTIIRKNEAAAAAAFFSNMDTVSISAEDQTNKAQLISSDIMKHLLQYRLTKSIPWFQVVLGGIQDAQTVGVVCAHIYWKYEQETPPKNEPSTDDEVEENPSQGKLPEGAFTMESLLEEHAEGEDSLEVAPPAAEAKPRVDKPCVDLVPVENIRISPSAPWTDPIHGSPFVIQLIPMYVMDVKAKTESGEWLPVSDGMLSRAGKTPDTTRAARQKDREDPTDSVASGAVDDYDTVWVQRHIHKFKGNDYEFYTLGTLALLTEPRPLKETVLHGRRPYEMGCCILEAHRVMPSGVYQISKGLQDEANEIANSRMDNVKFALNKKWFAKRGKEVDVAGLVRNVPGGVVMMDDPEKDVREISWPDVTQSAYEEQNRINLDMDELLGNFNPAALMASGMHQNSPARNMSMLSQSTGTLVEYLIRVYVETFVQPVLRQLVLLEQFYETDEVIIALAAKNAKVFQKYGVDRVTDDMLQQELTLSVNVGMGATDPMQKLQKFLSAMSAYAGLTKSPPPGMNLNEVGKEIFGHLGYSDGSRFFTVDDPQVIALQDQLKQAGQMIEEMKKKLEDKSAAHMVSLAKTKMSNTSKETITAMQEHAENIRSLAVHSVALLGAPHGKLK